MLVLCALAYRRSKYLARKLAYKEPEMINVVIRAGKLNPPPSPPPTPTPTPPPPPPKHTPEDGGGAEVSSCDLLGSALTDTVDSLDHDKVEDSNDTETHSPLHLEANTDFSEEGHAHEFEIEHEREHEHKDEHEVEIEHKIDEVNENETHSPLHLDTSSGFPDDTLNHDDTNEDNIGHGNGNGINVIGGGGGGDGGGGDGDDGEQGETHSPLHAMLSELRLTLDRMKERDTEFQTEFETDFDTDFEAEAEVESKAKVEAETEAEAESKVQLQIQIESETEVETDSDGNPIHYELNAFWGHGLPSPTSPVPHPPPPPPLPSPKSLPPSPPPLPVHLRGNRALSHSPTVFARSPGRNVPGRTASGAGRHQVVPRMRAREAKCSQSNV